MTKKKKKEEEVKERNGTGREGRGGQVERRGGKERKEDGREGEGRKIKGGGGWRMATSPRHDHQQASQTDSLTPLLTKISSLQCSKATAAKPQQATPLTCLRCSPCDPTSHWQWDWMGHCPLSTTQYPLQQLSRSPITLLPPSQRHRSIIAPMVAIRPWQFVVRFATH